MQEGKSIKLAEKSVGFWKSREIFRFMNEEFDYNKMNFEKI
jgi:hypothetical protein